MIVRTAVDIKLDIEQLIAEVERETGLDDWGGNSFRSELAALAEEVCGSNPNTFGLQEFVKRIRRTLHNRLALVNDRKRDADIATQIVRAPVVILGLPRTGTTFLHSLLEQDPATRSVAEWEGNRPSPPPDTASYQHDPRRAAARAETTDDLGWRQKHIHDAELSIECGPAFLNYAFLTMGYDCRWRLPRYRERMKEPIDQAYVWHKRCLQHFQSRMARDRWVLRSPEHLAHIDELFATYPDVRLIFTHRDPLQVLGSLGSMVAYMRAPHYEQGDSSAEARKTGIEMLEYWGHALGKALNFRATPGMDTRFHDVTYQQITADPMGTVRGIYERFAMALPADSEARMNAWLGSFKIDRYRDKYGTHEYTPEEYGLTPADVRNRFSDYNNRFL